MKNTINPTTAFDQAIASGALSVDPDSPSFHGHFTYTRSASILRDLNTEIGWRHIFTHKHTDDILCADCIHRQHAIPSR